MTVHPSARALHGSTLPILGPALENHRLLPNTLYSLSPQPARDQVLHELRHCREDNADKTYDLEYFVSCTMLPGKADETDVPRDMVATPWCRYGRRCIES